MTAWREALCSMPRQLGALMLSVQTSCWAHARRLQVQLAQAATCSSASSSIPPAWMCPLRFAAAHVGLKFQRACAAQNGHASGSALQAGPRSHAAPRPSRFGGTEARTAVPKQPQFEGGVTPIRLPPFPGPGNGHTPRLQNNQAAAQVRPAAQGTTVGLWAAPAVKAACPAQHLL